MYWLQSVHGLHELRVLQRSHMLHVLHMSQMLHVLHMLHGLRSALLPEAGFGTQVWTRGPFHVGAVGAFVAFEGTRPTIVC